MYSFDDLTSMVGKIVYTSDAKTFSQDEVNSFADMSGEHQWIQIDPERCKTDHVFALKKTVAHGFYTISTYGGNIVAAFPKSTIFLTEIVNVKFVRPIYVDDPVYNTCKLLSVEDISKDHFRLKIEGQTYHKETNKRCIKITCIGYMHKHLPSTKG